MAWTLVAGLGLFLLGMALLTDGLKAAAGRSVRRILLRYTSTRSRAAATGAVVTAALQSSTATTLATIGFVAAGIMALPQAIGVIIGANIGTTSTAWIVAGIGLRFSLAPIAGALVAVGAIWRIVAARRTAVANSIAGFGLVFLGIEGMQDGMGGVAERYDLLGLGGDGVFAGIMLILAGALATALVQSSSATMATVLAALAGGVFGLREAAFLAIGANIGTTITAAIGALGRSVAAKRTAGAHIAFNLGSAVPAVVLMPWLLDISAAVSAQPALRLAAFHTLFNVLGAALFLPLVPAMARTMERLVPERGPRLGRHLDGIATSAPEVAVEGIRSTLAELALEDIALLRSRLEHPRPSARRLAAAQDVVRRIQAEVMHLGGGAPGLKDALHALDHLDDALQEHGAIIDASLVDGSSAFVVRLRKALDDADHWLEAGLSTSPETIMEALREARGLRRNMRHDLLAQAAAEGSIDEVMGRIDALAWLDGQIRHLHRILMHLGGEARRSDAAPTE